MKEYILALYSKLLYEKWYDNKYRNQKIATLILTIISKNFLFLMVILTPMLFLKYNELQSNIGAIYLSTSAAYIFYIIMNKYPNIYSEMKAAQQSNERIRMIIGRRNKLLLFISGGSKSTFFNEANRHLTKEKYLSLINDLRKMSGYEKSNGLISNSIGFHFDYDGVGFLPHCIKIANETLKDISYIKSIPSIHRLEIYDAIVYLERELNIFLSQVNKGFVYEGLFVAYLIQSVDKVSYYSQRELPKYVGNRFNLKFKPTKEEKKTAKELHTLFYETMEIKNN
ncbi:TPA: hypothetical protein PXP81_004175 [Yersinia enterocolitica]|jgi:hypothetical protein|nr:hypothetical protein [Yersinia enterocolitica]